MPPASRWQSRGKIGDISSAIARVGSQAGYKINTEFGGHGVGRTMHGDPHVPNNGRRGRGLPLRPGLVIAIEPWFLQGTDKIYTDADGWTCGAGMAHEALTRSTQWQLPVTACSS